MKKLLLLGSAALVFVSTLVAAPDARGAPLLSDKAIESAVVAQLVPATAIGEDFGSSVACNPYNEKIPTEIVGIARACDAQEVVATGTEKVGIVAGRRRIAKEVSTVYVEMTRAVETGSRFYVQRT